MSSGANAWATCGYLQARHNVSRSKCMGHMWLSTGKTQHLQGQMHGPHVAIYRQDTISLGENAWATCGYLQARHNVFRSKCMGHMWLFSDNTQCHQA
ncbi:hypothetical protein ElyMa_004513100 [Elysia marginata]|uniref:Uncharacterized protein n=1 Tax=Elysia marginata TaxID=1093978 RepID=A0AAV4HLU0_9GAST|nr:hypothetical protein ElyMa_004513100 [Elysia marginata]